MAEPGERDYDGEDEPCYVCPACTLRLTPAELRPVAATAPNGKQAYGCPGCGGQVVPNAEYEVLSDN